MKVELIDYTGIGVADRWYAAKKLIFTKSTRLSVTAAGWYTIQRMGDEQIKRELDYMANTIPSSWEFVNYTFAVEGVSRDCTHQMVRTRYGAVYAQQTMRLTDMSDAEFYLSPKMEAADNKLRNMYLEVCEHALDNYSTLLEAGIAPEDARGILPGCTKTNTVVEYNLRTFADLCASRTGGRTQDEYRKVVDIMADRVLAVHPWAEVFLFRHGRDHFKALEEFAANRLGVLPEAKRELLKIVDQMRKS